MSTTWLTEARLALLPLLFMSRAFAADTSVAPGTMRLDYFHTGTVGQEIFAVDEVLVEPLPWPGHPGRHLDTTARGDYFFEVRDADSGALLFSRGYSSIYAEWEETAEARDSYRTFHESLRFPEPAAPATVRILRRDAANEFVQVWETVVDPRDMLVRRAPAPPRGRVMSIQDSGSPADKVDLLILGDGYTDQEQDKFAADARRMTEALFQVEPFRSRRSDFNVWAMAPPATASGVARPSSGLQRYSPIGASYDAFRSERYVLVFDNKRFRDIAAHAPYEFVEILVNNETYGGGGIYGMYGTAAVDSAWADYLFVHEFAHHFAALADEYYTSPVAYGPGDARVEPWEPNVTALLDPSAPKWAHLVAGATPVPTPWPKAEFDAYERDYQARRARLRAEGRPESEMNDLFREAQAHHARLFAGQPYRNDIGAFEGAYYEATGYYRPALNCLMFTRHPSFCDVCREAIEATIDLYTGAMVASSKRNKPLK